MSEIRTDANGRNYIYNEENPLNLSELESLRAEVASLKEDRDSWRNAHSEAARWLKEFADEIAELSQQLAATNKDAERYRWFRSNVSPNECWTIFGDDIDDYTEDEIDAAIDSAMLSAKVE